MQQTTFTCDKCGTQQVTKAPVIGPWNPMPPLPDKWVAGTTEVRGLSDTLTRITFHLCEECQGKLKEAGEFLHRQSVEIQSRDLMYEALRDTVLSIVADEGYEPAP